MRYTRKIGSFDVVVDCGADLAEQAEGLLTAITDMNEKGPAIKDGTTIQFGWSLLTLRKHGEELWVCEPYFGGDPFHDVLPGAENTLRVLLAQTSLLNELGSKGKDILFSDKIAVAKNCLKEDRIYLLRDRVEDKNDSGWYIGKFGETEKEKNKKDHIDFLYVYQVFNQRYAVLDVLTLPDGYKVSFFKEVVDLILDPEGKSVYPKR